MFFRAIQIPFLLLLVFASLIDVKAQCGAVVSTFPYSENFETAPAWTSGGTNSDWAWGTPSHPTISSAGGGTKCWIVGGLTGSFYNYAEQSWVMSPCFDFTNLTYPWISFKIFWEDEWKYDGLVLQSSTDGGTTWANVGAFGDAVDCLNANWYDYNNIINLTAANPKDGWAGRTGATAGSCQGGHGSLGWVNAKHCMSSLAGLPSVRFRFYFGAGTTCNSYDGIAFDDIYIDNAPPNVAGFTFACSGINTINFTNTSTPCPTGYLWNFGDGATSILQNPSHTYSTAGTYNVTLTSSGPCNAPGTLTLPVNIINVTASVTNITCNGANDGTATATVTGGTAPFTYAWTPGNSTTSTITGLSSGSYTVSVSATNSCSSTATATITQPPLLTASTTVTPISCFGDNNGSATVTALGGTAPYSYFWVPSGNTSATIGNLSQGADTVLVADSNSCITAAIATIIQPASALNVSTINTATTCGISNGTASATVTGGTAPYSYAWSPSGGATTNATALASGTYTINITDAHNCVISDNTTIAASTGVTALTASTPINCYGGTNGTASVTVNGGSSPYSYSWNSGQTSTTITNLNAGNYCVKVTDASGCFDSTCILLPNPSRVTVDFTSDPTVTDIQNSVIHFTSSSSGASTWHWNFGDTTGSNAQNPIHTYTSLGTYPVVLIVTNAQGCTDSIIHDIIINDEFVFYAPNAFTPNGDYHNDVFIPKGTGWDPNMYEFWVFDRWGNMIFHTTDMNTGWNGKIKNSNVNAERDVYAWRVQVSSTTGDQHNYTGIVTVLR
jgi:gliding motility-associated-like protein